jgi:hypothetical protein
MGHFHAITSQYRLDGGNARTCSCSGCERPECAHKRIEHRNSHQWGNESAFSSMILCASAGLAQNRSRTSTRSEAYIKAAARSLFSLKKNGRGRYFKRKAKRRHARAPRLKEGWTGSEEIRAKRRLHNDLAMLAAQVQLRARRNALAMLAAQFQSRARQIIKSAASQHPSLFIQSKSQCCASTHLRSGVGWGVG